VSEGTFFRRLHGTALRVQLPLVLATVPLAAAIYGLAVAPVIVDEAMAGASADAREAAQAAMALVVATMIGCVLVASLGAALLLRGSVRAVVERMHAATSAIADGDFAHRIGGERSDELGRLACSIDTMAERLERLEQARRRLLACVSHELRTPLTIIRGHAYTLARSERDAVRRDRLELVEEEAARLGELVEDLVDASSLHAGSVRLRVERCDLALLVDATVARFRDAATARGVRIEVRGVERPLPIDADPARVEQVLANVVANAVRHADHGTAIELQLAARRGAHPRFVTIANRGPAVPGELAGRIFEPFVQGEQARGRVGLGLAIAHGLASAHGGSLTLESSGVLSGVVEFRLMLPPPARLPRATEPDLPAAHVPAVRRPALRLVES
jgi:two-component system sensor histidine kinase BaeS